MTKVPLEVTKRFTFEAAHNLPWHQGKCHNLHGHSFMLEVTLKGAVHPDDGRPDSGMVSDFSFVKEKISPIIEEHLDHKNLNNILENPTAENLTLWLVEKFKVLFGHRLDKVRLYETSTGWVEWNRRNEW